MKTTRPRGRQGYNDQFLSDVLLNYKLITFPELFSYDGSKHMTSANCTITAAKWPISFSHKIPCTVRCELFFSCSGMYR